MLIIYLHTFKPFQVLQFNESNLIYQVYLSNMNNLVQLYHFMLEIISKSKVGDRNRR